MMIFFTQENIIFQIKYQRYHFLEESQRGDSVDHVKVPAVACRGDFFGRRQSPLSASGVRGHIFNQSEHCNDGQSARRGLTAHTLSDGSMLCITIFFLKLEKKRKHSTA